MASCCASETSNARRCEPTLRKSHSSLSDGVSISTTWREIKVTYSNYNNSYTKGYEYKDNVISRIT